MGKGLNILGCFENSDGFNSCIGMRPASIVSVDGIGIVLTDSQRATLLGKSSWRLAVADLSRQGDFGGVVKFAAIRDISDVLGKLFESEVLKLRPSFSWEESFLHKELSNCFAENCNLGMGDGEQTDEVKEGEEAEDFVSWKIGSPSE